ncbi:cardiolipin synthase [Ferrimonas sp. SCSIO 43195]|uniref:cardiolipin synthase n=1 Tax=Ferrimonas sp. SCSIO 43195 TaxID=2822844 RepID=UPI002074DD57|nr:cardiolipin synthase [Ferrimonas sp. SCSIO 43195]USD39355.1 cardiolipin synthase [Ferrimonas sp. SCSIO 43195]
MSQFYQLLTLTLVAAYWIVIAGVSLRIVLKRRPFGVSLAWLLLIYIIPLFGVVVYLLFGELNIGRKRTQRVKEMTAPFKYWNERLHRQAQSDRRLGQHARPLHELSLRRLGIPALLGNDLELIENSQTILRRIIDDIHQASDTIHMEFYIWHPGGLADEVADALIQARQRGVTVRLLLDGAGSREFFNSRWPDTLMQNGVSIVKALGVNPLRMFLRRMDLRQHRKIVVIDQRIAYTGSMNLVDSRYFKQSAGVGEWIDIMVRLTGPSVCSLAALQSWDWEFETDERLLDEIALPQVESPLSHRHAEDSVQVIPSGQGLPESIIQQVLLLSIYHAKHSITLTSPYFVPSEQLLDALRTAAQSGVEVNLIIPDKNDSFMVEWASRAFFTELLNAGVAIYRFNGGLLHTKSMLIDDDHCIIGTVNLDIRSLLLNSEVSLAIDDPDFCQELGQLLDRYLQQSNRIDAHQWQLRPMWKKLVEQFFYTFAPLL